MPAKERTPKELLAQSNHVLYEVQMLFALGRYCETGELDTAIAGPDRAGLPARNAVIEAFEIHARQLIEFLTHQRNGRRATARDWAKGWSVPKAEAQELRELREAFSERVAHLSWRRSGFTRDDQLVMTREIEGKLRPLLSRFLEEANPGGLCAGFLKEARLALSPDEAKSEEPCFEALADPDRMGRVKPTQAPGTIAGTATQALSEIADDGRRGR